MHQPSSRKTGSTPFHIRPGQLLDQGPLLHLLSLPLPFSTLEVQCAQELIQEALSSGKRDYFLLVATDDLGQLCGYVCYGPTPLTQSAWDLYWVVSHPEKTRQGIATALVYAMERDIWERKGRIVRIETSSTPGYLAAQAFYERAGYSHVGRIPDFYSPSDDLVLFYKSLSDGSLSGR